MTLSDSSTSRVSLNMVHRQSTAESNESLSLMASIISFSNGEFTTSIVGISRSQEAIQE